MLTIAIATMKRWEFLQDSLPVYLEQPIVKEIVICDETGEDVEAILKAPWGKDPKLKLVKNPRKLGIYLNKRKALSLATQPWVAVLDSDNFFPESWFEMVEERLKGVKENDKILFGSADFVTISQSGESVQHCEQFSGIVLNTKCWNGFLEQDKSNFLLNDGNWIVPRGALDVLPEMPTIDVFAADAIYMLWLWIRAGYSIEYIKGLTYQHIVHSGSSWLQTEAESTRVLMNTDWRL
jgi:hypothetical protein